MSLIFIFLRSSGIGFLMLMTLLLIFGITQAFEESSFHFFSSVYSLLLLEVRISWLKFLFSYARDAAVLFISTQDS